MKLTIIKIVSNYDPKGKTYIFFNLRHFERISFYMRNNCDVR